MGVNERGYGRVVWWWERELGSSATGRKGNHVVAIASWKVRSLEKRRTDVPEGDLGAESRVKKSRVDLRAQKGSQRVLFCMGITKYQQGRRWAEMTRESGDELRQEEETHQRERLVVERR